MKKEDSLALIGIAVAVAIGCLLVFTLGSTDQVSRWTMASIIGLAFGIQWLAFIPAYLKRTEHFYDLVGGSSFVGVTLFSLLLSPSLDLRSVLLFAMILLWGGRLSIFLFKRIQKAGKDGRFEDIKQSFPRFLFAWTAQGLWVSFMLAPVFVSVLQPTGSIDAFLLIGALVWIFGYGFEVVADHQKSRFKARPENEGKFINEGLWKLSRHPNYFGEITLWVGITVIAIPSLSGWQFIALASPLFIFSLLRFISGVPMLEKRADEKWGHLEAYQKYKRGTSRFLPRLSRIGS